MLANYKPFVDRMISKYEGGYGWNQKDPGGPTKYGITCYDLAEHRGLKMTSMATWAPTVEAMPLSEAEDIYANKYAKYVDFNALPAGVDCAFMDYAVNSGVGRPCLVARSLLGLKSSSAAVDAALLAAIAKVDAKDLIKKLDAERLVFMHAIRGGSAWVEFGHGWQARVDDLTTYSEHLAAGSTHETAPPAPDLTKVATPKATHVPNTAPGKTMGGAAGGMVAAHVAGAPWYGVVGVGLAIVAAGIGYELWEESKTNAANRVVHA